MTQLLQKIFLCVLLIQTAMSAFGHEKIIFHLPKWKVIAEEKNETQQEVVYAPKKPVSSEIKDRVFIKTLIGKTDIGAQQWMEKLRGDREVECNFFSVIEIPVKGFDPAPASGQVLYCGEEKASGKGVISMQRVTQGKENLYVIERRWTTYPFDNPENAFVVREEIMPWIRNMTHAFLCGTEEIPCKKRKNK